LVFFVGPCSNNIERIRFVTSKEKDPMLSTISKILNAPLYQISSYYDYIVDISNGKLLFLKRPDQMWTYHKPRIDKLKIYFFVMLISILQVMKIMLLHIARLKMHLLVHVTTSGIASQNKPTRFYVIMTKQLVYSANK